jgi:hypothetical protein
MTSILTDDPKCCGLSIPVTLVLYRIDPHLGAMVGASRDGKVGAVKSLPALSEVSSSACAQGGRDLGEKPVVIGIFLLEHANVAFSAGMYKHLRAES